MCSGVLVAVHHDPEGDRSRLKKQALAVAAPPCGLIMADVRRMMGEATAAAERRGQRQLAAALHRDLLDIVDEVVLAQHVPPHRGQERHPHVVVGERVPEELAGRGVDILVVEPFSRQFSELRPEVFYGKHFQLIRAFLKKSLYP